MIYYKTGRIYRLDGEPQWHKSTISKNPYKQSLYRHIGAGSKTAKSCKGCETAFRRGK